MADDTLLYIFNILIYGFCFTAFLSYFLSFFKSENLKVFNTSLFHYSIKLIRVVAIAYALYYLYSILYFYTTNELTFFSERATGPYAFMYWLMLLQPIIFCLLIQLFWIKKLQKKSVLNSIVVLFIFIIVLCNGANLERFVIILTSWHRDYAPDGFSTELLSSLYPKVLIILVIERTFIFMGLVLLIRFIDLRIKSKS